MQEHQPLKSNQASSHSGLLHSFLWPNLTSHDHAIVFAWWTNLDRRTQQELTQLFQLNHDCLFSDWPSDEPVPRVIGGYFADAEELDFLGEWEESWREYLQSHHPEYTGSNISTSGIFIVSQFRSFSFLGVGNVLADWNLTTCPRQERPPSTWK